MRLMRLMRHQMESHHVCKSHRASSEHIEKLHPENPRVNHERECRAAAAAAAAAVLSPASQNGLKVLKVPPPSAPGIMEQVART